MLTFWADTQQPISGPQYDASLHDLDDRLKMIETRGLQATGVSSIVWDSSLGTVLFTFTDGSSYGPLNLPVSLFVPRGAWATGATYRLRDYASVDGSSYVCLADHLAGVFADDLAAGKWMVVALKGKDGLPGAPFMTYRNIYDPTVTYAPGDGVLFGNGSGFGIYRLSSPAPAGTAPGALQPGTPYPYWLLTTAFSPTTEHGAAVSGKPAAGLVVYRRKLARGQSLQAALAGAVASLGTAPAASWKLSVQKNGAEVATITFAAGSKVPTLAGSASVFVTGDVLQIVAPAAQDANAADLDFALVALLT